MSVPLSINFSHLEKTARHLGSQDYAVCPPHPVDTPCWRNRGLKPHIEGDPVENECTNCWLTWLIYGE